MPKDNTKTKFILKSNVEGRPLVLTTDVEVSITTAKAIELHNKIKQLIKQAEIDCSYDNFTPHVVKHDPTS